MTSDEMRAAAAVFVRRGRGEPPKPIESSDMLICLRTCPDCDGRGWFLIRPFATGGGDGSGGLANKTQCLTCLDAEAYFKQHGKLPEELATPSGVEEQTK